ncbi:MAG TPA: protein kinase, partial [Gemmatimonadaceae bacterium]|nr:protein kinase [Gemmatimonadaceae bacterium]
RGIVHRDIKPDNILLSGGSATVTDFGIAKAIQAARSHGDGSHPETLTQIGSSIGTPAYMAPEQAAADPDTNHRADIYAFGCTAYELLAGRPPFVEKSPQRLLAAQMSDTPQAITSFRAETPAALAELVMRCLEKDQDARPQQAAHLVQVLETVTSGGGHAPMPAVLLSGRGMLGKALMAYAVAFIFVAIVAKASIVAIGLPGWVFPGAMFVMALGLPVILFTAYVHHATRSLVTQTPTYTPGGSPAAAAHGTMATLAMRASPHLSWRRTWVGGAVAVGAFVLIIGVYMGMRSMGIGPFGSLLGKGTMQRNEKLLVADFTNSTQDTTIAVVVTDAFRTALAQSRAVAVAEPNELREVLRRMQRSPNLPIDFGVAREMASREGMKAIVTGDVIGYGGSYRVSARLVEAQTGVELARFLVEAASDADLLPAIDKLAKNVREKIGESLKQVQATPALERVTTPSLAALKKYVQGSRLMSEGADGARGIALLEEAVALDTGFAMAYRRLAAEYSNRQQADKAMLLLQKAYDHRDRLSDAERYIVLGSYFYRGPQQDLAKTISAYETLLDLQPDNYTALNNVAIAYRWHRNWPKAEEVLKRSLATGYGPAVSHNQLIWTLWNAGKKEEAWQAMARYDSTYPNTPQRYARRWELHYADRQFDSAAADVAQALADDRVNGMARAFAIDSDARTLRTRGRLTDAARRVRESADIQAQNGRPQARLEAAIDLAIDAAVLLENKPRAIAVLDAALSTQPLETIPAVVRPYVGLTLAYAFTGQAARAEAVLASFEAGRAGTVRYQDEVERMTMRGAVAFAAGRFDEAARHFTVSSSIGDCMSCDLSLLGLSYDRAGQADSAIAVYERYLASPDHWRFISDQLLLGLTFRRLGELYEARGEVAKAHQNYAAFVDLWKDADPELQPRVAAARRRMARLRDVEPRPR